MRKIKYVHVFWLLTYAGFPSILVGLSLGSWMASYLSCSLDRRYQFPPPTSEIPVPSSSSEFLSCAASTTELYTHKHKG
jgi:hypothetical protein